MWLEHGRHSAAEHERVGQEGGVALLSGSLCAHILTHTLSNQEGGMEPSGLDTEVAELFSPSSRPPPLLRP